MKKSFVEILTLLVGASAIGCLTYLFLDLLERIAFFHLSLNSGNPYHLLLIPAVLFILEAIRRRTLYFPSKVSELPQERSSAYWSRMMPFWHFLGTVSSHLAGVSVGREGAAVLYSAGLVRLTGQEWRFWGPVFSSVGFAAITGQFWVGPVFMMELFGPTQFIQKSYSLAGSLAAVLVLQSLTKESLFLPLQIQDHEGFFQKLVFLFLFAAAAGLLIRIYKDVHVSLGERLRSSFVLRTVVSVLIAGFLFLPELRKFQSLSLGQMTDLTSFAGGIADAVTKLCFTVFSTSLGFAGGEFIPLVYSGLSFGTGFFRYFGFDPVLGAALGAYLLFAGATRFRWTALVLALTLLGPGWLFWLLYTIWICIFFSGPRSLYKKEAFVI